MNGRAATPKPKVLQATLRKLTEALAHELARPTQAAPEWSDVEWTLARAVAAMHGVSPLLSRILRWQGPAGWKQFLDEQRAHTAKRHRRICDLLSILDRRTRAHGVPAVPLKGVALHALGVYGSGDRPMADIDLLVRPADAERAAGVLESLGLYECYRTWKERVFTPIDGNAPSDLGEHARNDIKIELHERICERLPWRITDISARIFPATWQPGLNAYPSNASLAIHLLLHAAGSMAMQGLRLMHLHDLAQLSSRMTDEDWNEVLGLRAHGGLWWAYPPLKLTSRYYPSEIPPRVLAALAGDCPYLLRRIAGRKSLYDVSYSYPWVDALPGIEWSQSLREAFGYAANRVWPSATQVALRSRFADTQAGAKRSEWAHASQSARILRWMVSRPPRLFTMSAVQAALAQMP